MRIAHGKAACNVYIYRMVTITAMEFKARCLQLLDQVSQTGKSVQITKDGKVVAELFAPPCERQFSGPGFARNNITLIGDIIEPVDVQWEAMQ